MTLWETIFAGAVGAVILVTLQTRAARIRNHEERRQSDLQEALKAIDYTAGAMDRRIQANSRFWTRFNSPDYNNSDRETFIKEIDLWMSQYSTIFAKLYHYFGRSERANFILFQNTLAYNTQVIERSMRWGYEHLSTADKQEHDSVEGHLRLLRRDVRRLLARLNRAAAEGKVGRSQYINDLQRGRPDEISRVYLIQRLFGWKD